MSGQRIEIYQSLWAMELRQPGLTELTLPQKFARAAGDGFAGLCLDLGMSDVPEANEARPLFGEYGLKCLFNGFPRSDDELRFMLDMSLGFGAPYLTIIGQVMPVSVDEMIDLAGRWLEIAAGSGQTLLFETHRHGLLNDLYATLQILEALPDLQLCADLSHFVVDREFALPLDEASAGMISRVLARSQSFQGRIASNEQVQIQVGFPQHQAWVAQFEAWWTEGIAGWRGRHADDATVTFLCELGPPPYAMTGQDGRELSDRWEEALQIRQKVLAIWAATDPAAA